MQLDHDPLPAPRPPLEDGRVHRPLAAGAVAVGILLALGHLIMAVLGDGRRFCARIDYVHEDSPRGTIGAVKLVEELDEPFLVMNGDLLTDFDYRGLMDAHLKEGAMLSVGVY